MEKVVLAYSGGLDTSYCLLYLSKIKKLEVHTAVVNTGGFSDDELSDIEKKAIQMGSKSHTVINAIPEFYTKCIRYLIYGNVLRNNTYPLSVSAERVFQAISIVNHAIELNADYIAHGSTGAGNDQVRFDLIFQIMAPDKEIITPIRDMKLSRKEEVEFLKEHGINLDWNKAQYSINKGIWGTSVGGAETLTSSDYLPEEAWPSKILKKEDQSITLHFDEGELTGIDDYSADPVKCIQKLEDLAAPYGIGRDIHVGDTIIGIKGRVGFESAAPVIIIKSHHLLEKHVLTKWQQYWKDQISNWYGMQIHEGQYLEPSLRDMEAMLESSQKNVTGKVFVKLSHKQFIVEGISSKHDLMQSGFGQYGEVNNAWTGEDVKSFTKIMSNQMKIFNSVNSKSHD